MEQLPNQKTLESEEKTHRKRQRSRIILEVRNLKKYFPITTGILFQHVAGLIKAVDDISLFIRQGEILGLVGESGCGKTTTGRCIIQLERPTSGEILFEGKDLSKMTESEIRVMRRRIQVIFQDPYSSLNPRMKVGQIIGEPLHVHSFVNNKKERKDQVVELLSVVGLSSSISERFPHELSGGQRQRVVIARAHSMKPSFIVCDEPVSALGVSIQAQIITLLEDLQEEFGLTYLFIAHDLSVVRHISDRIAVMYLGKILEIADRQQLYESPLHPYTRALLSAVPIPDPVVENQRERIILKGEVHSPFNLPPGCVFHPRCPIGSQGCDQKVPELQEVSSNHWVACQKQKA